MDWYIHTISVKVMVHKLNVPFITSLELSCKLENNSAQFKGQSNYITYSHSVL